MAKNNVKLNREKERAALDILKLKKQMGALNKEYDKLESFLTLNMKVGEEIETVIGKVDRSMLSKRFVDSESLFKMLPLTNFMKCVSIKVAKAEDFLGLEELAQISETKEYDKLNVVLKKEPVRTSKEA